MAEKHVYFVSFVLGTSFSNCFVEMDEIVTGREQMGKVKDSLIDQLRRQACSEPEDQVTIINWELFHSDGT